MPVLFNRRKHKISINLGNGKRVVLEANAKAKVSDKDVSSYGVQTALGGKDITILAGDTASKSAPKAEEKTETKSETKTEVKSDTDEKIQKFEKRNKDDLD